MKEELDIAAILMDKPKGTKLWSPIFGDCKLTDIPIHNNSMEVVTKSSCFYFRKNGRYIEGGEVCLFPSKEMRDWEKFTWKKGDVLTNENGLTCMFLKWIDDEYTKFVGVYTHFNGLHNRHLNLLTNEYAKMSDEKVDEVIKEIESYYGGKLNLETLEIEKQPEFKDGDIVALEENCNYYGTISIFKKFEDGGINFLVYVSLINHKINKNRTLCCYDRKLRPATDSEKQQLFEALAKEGKRWNPETLQVEDLPKKCEFEPFQKVLVRNAYSDRWSPAFFSNYNKNSIDGHLYGIVGGGYAYYKECIPYNNQTAHLLGTTEEWKGGING